MVILERTLYIVDKKTGATLKNTMVSYNEGSETRTLQTTEHGTIELIGCIDEKTKFTAEGYCESEVLGSDQVVKMTKITSKIHSLFIMNQFDDFSNYFNFEIVVVEILMLL